jgi:hypothetical protein
MVGKKERGERREERGKRKERPSKRPCHPDKGGSFDPGSDETSKKTSHPDKGRIVIPGRKDCHPEAKRGIRPDKGLLNSDEGRISTQQ